MEIFEIGETVWIAAYEQKSEYEPCPVCYGKKEVVVVLGNGDRVGTECGYCCRGWSGPQGRVEKSTYIGAFAKQGTITGVDARQYEKGMSVTYWFGHIGHGADIVARTFDEAVRLGEISAEKMNKQKIEKKEEAAKFNVNKSYSWNAGYYLKQAERSEQDLLRYQKLAHIMKSKSRDKEDLDAPVK